LTFCVTLACRDWQRHASRWASSGNTSRLSSQPIAFVCHFVLAYYLERYADLENSEATDALLAGSMGIFGGEADNDAQRNELAAFGFIGRQQHV
jgi:hypothetical protein